MGLHRNTRRKSVRYRFEKAQQADRRPRQAPIEARIPGGGWIFSRRCRGCILPALRAAVFSGNRPLAVAQRGPVHATMRGTRGLREGIWTQRPELPRGGLRWHDGRKRRRQEKIVWNVLSKCDYFSDVDNEVMAYVVAPRLFEVD